MLRRTPGRFRWGIAAVASVLTAVPLAASQVAEPVRLMAVHSSPASPPLQLCPHDNRRVAESSFPAEIELGPYDQHHNGDGVRTCTFGARHAITYQCTGGSTKTEIHAVESHRGFAGRVNRNKHPVTCDGQRHTLSADRAFGGRTGPFHVHWHVHGKDGWGSWSSALLRIEAGGAVGGGGGGSW